MFPFSVFLLIYLFVEKEIEIESKRPRVSAPHVEADEKNSIAVQANDYEIERKSGILPARRRIIPVKFRFVGHDILCNSDL